LARLREKPVSKIAEDLGISDSCLRGWMAQADIDDGAKPGLSSDERAELVKLRRANRDSRWKSRSSSGPPRSSLGRTSSQNDVHLHR
jgi:transposase-like protein